MPFPEKTKDPQATLDYGFRLGVPVDGEPAYLESDETVTASTWTIETGLSTTSNTVSPDGKTTIVWLSGGTDGVDYLITNHITTSKGRQDDRSMIIKVRQR